MTESTRAVAEFWALFRERAADLAAASSADDVVYDVLLERLQRIDAGLYLEFCADCRGCELVVTAEGKRSLFPLVRSIVAAAPEVDGWTIRALKPKLGFPEKVCWNGVELAIDDIVFDPLEAEGSDALGLRIYVPGIDEKDIDDAHNAILSALDHGLGEERFAEAVRHTEVRALPAGEGRDVFIPLTDLDSFIRWRERGRD